MSHRRISIFDTTLRDGEQSPGIALQPHDKAEIAEQLERLGVDVVEAGFPGASPGDFEGVRAVAAAVTEPSVAHVTLGRLLPSGLVASRLFSFLRGLKNASAGFGLSFLCRLRRHP